MDLFRLDEIKTLHQIDLITIKEKRGFDKYLEENFVPTYNNNNLDFLGYVKRRQENESIKTKMSSKSGE